MKNKVLSFFILQIFVVSSFVFIFGEQNLFVKENNIETINSSFVEEKANENNHWMIDYENSDNVSSMGNYIIGSVVENDTGQYIKITNSSCNFNLFSPNDIDDFIALDPTAILTIYDITEGEYNSVYEQQIEYGSDFWLGSWVGGANSINFNITSPILLDGFQLEDFHQYCVGLNFNKGDDMRVFTDTLELSVPQLSSFTTTPSENSIIIDYEFSNSSSAVEFDYNDIYVKVKNKKYSIGNDPVGQYTIEKLKPATQYSITIGYEVTKILSADNTYDIVGEYKTNVSTIMPENYGEQAVQIAFILLLILLIILLIFIILIVYWNYQRRKISGMALVVGEDTQAYDPVYQYNYYQQEDEVAVPNASSSKGDEVYGYFDDVQDDYYQDEYYQDEEVAGYFDEVYDDYDESGINDYEEGW